MSELKDKSVDTIREMLFELSCNEDIDSNEFDIQFENEQEVTKGFSVNINELAGVSVTAIDKLTARNAELEAALTDLLQGDKHEYLTKIAIVRNARKALEQAK